MRPQCVSIQRYLSDYIDSTLSGRQTVIVAQHLQSCSACRRELESLKRTKALLQNFYVEPEPPDGYRSHFWQQLQHTIESRPRPIWWRVGVLWQTFAWKGGALVDRFTHFCGTFINTPMEWVFRWLRLSPQYSFILLTTLTLLLVSQLVQVLDERNQLHKNEPNIAKFFAGMSDSFPVTGNRELMNTRERIPGISQAVFEQPVQNAQKVSNQLSSDGVLLSSDGVLEERWHNSYTSSKTVDDKDMLTAVTIGGDASSDLIAFTQLSSPKPLMTREDFSHPLGVIRPPFPDKFTWEGRRSNGFIEMLMNVQIPNFSITEVYDAVKL